MTSKEKQLIESEEIFRTLTEQSFLGVAILQNNFIKYVNKQLAHTFGYTAEEIMNWGKGGFISVIHPDDRENVEEQAKKKQLGEEGVIDQYQFRGIKKNGDTIWLEVFSKTINYKGKMADFVTIHNITDKNISEQELKESEEKYRSLFNNAPFAIVLFNIEGIILDCNDATTDITGYSKEELIGNNFRNFNFYVNIKNSSLEDRSKQISSGKTPKAREILLYKKDGTQFWARTHIEFIQLGDNTYIQAMIHDITEQKDSEEKLKESELKFRSIIEAIPDLYFLLSKDTTILDFRGKQEILHVPPEEFMQKKVVDILPPYIGEETKKFVNKTLMTKQPQSLEYELLVQNKIHFFEARFFYLSKKKVSCFVRDITERKKIEKDISDLAKFPSENPNPVLRVNKEKILYINQSGKYLFDTTEGRKIPILLEEMINKAFDDITLKIFEIEVDDKIYSFNIAPIEQEGYANIYGQEITERKNSEIALKTEKKFTEDILNSTLDTIFVFDPETGKALRWNKMFKDMAGYSDEEISSMKAPDSYYSEEDLNIASEAMKKLKEKGKTTLELSLITKDGRKIPYEYKATVLKEPNGKFSIVSVGRDMKERKEAEQKLKESEEKFRNITEQSLMGISVIQDGVFKYINERSAEVNGYSMDEIRNWKPNEFAKIIHPEDREFVMEQARKKQDGEPNVINQYPFRIIQKNGEIRWLDIFSKTINYEGSPADLTMTIDITDKIEAEQKLKESEIIFRDLYEEAPNAYFSIGIDKAILRCNKAAERLLGYTKDELLKLKVSDLYFVTKHGIEKAEKVFKQFKNGGSIKDVELQMKHKNGASVWVSLSVKPIIDPDGGVIESRSMILDITKRKNTEKALKESEQRYREAYDMATFYKDLFTHDMNNILQIINSSAEIIGFQLGDSEKSQFIQNMTKMIRNQVDRGSKLISDVRTLTELDEENMSTKQINISKFLTRSINFIKKAYSERSVFIVAENLDQTYYTIANELLQDVFDNILINGVKYNENGEVEIIIKISTQIFDGKKYIKIEFSDNGIGVPDDRKEVIFQRGNRELKGTKGMGIGLSLVKKILEIFKGEIWVEDKIKGDYTKGSNFIVLLPGVE